MCAEYQIPRTYKDVLLFVCKFTTQNLKSEKSVVRLAGSDDRLNVHLVHPCKILEAKELVRI